MQASAALLMHQFEWSACGKAQAQRQDEVRGGGRDSEVRPVPVSHALTVLISRGEGPVEHVLPTTGRGERDHSGGSEQGGQGPSEGRNAEGGGAQAETWLGSQLGGPVREPQPAGKEGPGCQGSQPPPRQQSALVFYSLPHLKGPRPCAPSKPVFRKELIPPGRQGMLLPRGLSQGLRPAPAAPLTSEAQLTVANPTVLRRALLLLLAAAPAPLDTLVELAPAMPPRVLLQALLLGPSVLKPNLPHEQKGHI